jgi:hypothetical protein
MLHWFAEEREQTKTLNKLEDIGVQNVEAYMKSSLGEFAITPLMGILAIIASTRLDKRTSRRGFIKKGLKLFGVGTGLATIGRAAPSADSYSTSPELSTVFQKITDLTKFKASSSSWLHGRTGLLYTKTKEATERLINLPAGSQSSVVMGWPHTYEATNITENDNARDKFILDYAQSFFQDVYPLIMEGQSELQDNEEYKQSIKDTIALLFSLVDVYDLNQPPTLHANDPVQTLKEAIKIKYRYISPLVSSILTPFGNAHAELTEKYNMYEVNPELPFVKYSS